jgi:hypothetical protein
MIAALVGDDNHSGAPDGLPNLCGGLGKYGSSTPRLKNLGPSGPFRVDHHDPSGQIT